MGTPTLAEPDAPTAPKVSPVALTWSAIAVLVPIILALVSSMGAIDLAYHLRTGEEILASGSLPTVDTFTFSVHGAPWVDQQWGAQIVLTAVFDIGGWPTLLAFQAALEIASQRLESERIQVG